MVCTLEAEPGRSEFEANHGYIVKTLKRKKKKRQQKRLIVHMSVGVYAGVGTQREHWVSSVFSTYSF